MAQQITSTNSSSILDPTVVVQSSESIKTSDLTSILSIQPKKFFHSDITREAITPPNGQPHVRVEAVLPKWWTLIAFEPTLSMMLTDSQADAVAYIFSDTLDPSEELVISDEKGYRSYKPGGTYDDACSRNDSEVWVTSWMRECTLQDDFNIQINDSTRRDLPWIWF
ncbi:hypothetical protein HN873_001452 [Arachis hypogaea]